jgi:glycosyltransferase involved in cell wall biosynthesis
VLDGRTGRVVAPDAAAIADAVLGLLDDPAIRTEFGLAARQHALTAFSQAAVNEQLMALYRRGPRQPHG